MSPTTRHAKQHAKARARRRRTAQERLERDRPQAQQAAEVFEQALLDVGLPANLVAEIEEIIFSLKHYGRFVGCEALELKALSQGVDEKAA
jgi:hypothetical protein